MGIEVDLDSFGLCSSPFACNNNILKGDGLCSVDITLEHDSPLILSGGHGVALKTKRGEQRNQGHILYPSILSSCDAHAYVKSVVPNDTWNRGLDAIF